MASVPDPRCVTVGLMVTIATPPRGRRPPPRWLLVALGVVVFAAVVQFVVVPRLAGPPGLPSLDESRRRVAGIQLARYAAREVHGTFLPPAALTLAVHEQFLQRSISASLPFEQEFDDGRILTRLDSVSVDVADGGTIITLRGRGRLSANAGVYADLVVQGTLDIEDIDFEHGRVIPHLEFTDVRVVGTEASAIGAMLNPVASYFTHRSAADWNRFQPVLPLPLHFAKWVSVPAVVGDVSLPAVGFPVGLRFQAVTALERRLVLSIELLPDSSRGAIAGPPIGPWDSPIDTPRPRFRDRVVGLVTRSETRGLPRPPSAEQISALRERVFALSAGDSLWNTLLAAEHDLMVLVPEPLLLTLVRRATREYGTGVDIALEPDLDEEIEETIRVKVLGQSIEAGEIKAAIHVDRIRGRLVASGQPSVDLRPPDGLAVTMPLTLSGGRGTARIDAVWDPKAAAWMVCKGFEASARVDGTIGQLAHEVLGTLRFRVEEGKIVGRSMLRRDRVRLPLDLTPESWARLRAIFEKQDRLLRCSVIDPDRMVELLRGLGRRGVRVRLPAELPGFELPLEFAPSRIDSTYSIGVDVRGVEVTMTRNALVASLDGVVELQTVVGARDTTAAEVVRRPLPPRR